MHEITARRRVGYGLRARRVSCAVAAGLALFAAGGAAAQHQAASPVASMPSGLAAAFSATVGGEQARFAAVPRHGELVTHGGGLETVFGSTGPAVRAAGGHVSLQLTALGRGGLLAQPAAARPAAGGSRVSYRRGSVEEWYLNGPLGIEQGFTLAKRPNGAGRVTIAVRTSGLAPKLIGGELRFSGADGRPVLSYGGLTAIDAAGRSLPAQLALDGRTLLLRVDDAGARYPLTIDPLLQQGPKLTGAGETGNAGFGRAVAISGDGKTALVAGPADDTNKGAVWVFTRTGSAWAQQGNKLTGGGETGNGQFGSSVALSSDGSTALVGGFSDDGQKGAAWVFTRSGTTWTQQGAKLTGAGAVGTALFGYSAALSADGSTAAIGGPYDDAYKGAIWIFVRTGTTWTAQGPKLTGTGGVPASYLGWSVALSSDGSTALTGGPSDAAGKGAAWVFTRSGTTWTQQGPKLTGTGEDGPAQFGSSVALAADGSTALIGGQGDASFKGAVWAFSRSGTTWSAQGNKLTATGQIGNGAFGFSVALAADGSTALIGARADAGKGAAFLFTRSGVAWSQQGDKITAFDDVGSAQVAYSVALAADGKTGLLGAPGDDGSKGAAFALDNALPAVASISPTSGPAAGGTLVVVTGTGFTSATAVKFGSTEATLTRVRSDTELSAVSPPGTAGAVDITVANPNGTSSAVSADRFTYVGPVTPPKPAVNPIVARIVFANVVRHGQLRTLTLRIRVSVKANAKLRLTRRGVVKFQKTAPVKGGTNNITGTVGPAAVKGTYQLQVTLTDAKGNKRVYNATVPVPK